MQDKPPQWIYPLIISLGSVAAVVFTPGLPEMQAQFGVDSDAIQATVSVFVLGYALTQLVYGPIANRYGRKATLVGALAVGIIGTLLCPIAGMLGSYQLLMAGRLISALGTGGGLTLALTMIGDVYAVSEARKILSIAAVAFATLPALAIFVGGYLVSWFGWESCFYSLALYLLTVLLITRSIPETCPEEERELLSIGKIIRDYVDVAKDLHLWIHAILWGLCTGIVYLFAATSPLIAIPILGAAPQTFGAYSLLISVGMIFGTLITWRLAQGTGPYVMMAIGWVVMTGSAWALWGLSHSGLLSMNSLFGTATILFAAMPLVFTTAGALATNRARNKAAASSLVACTNMMMGWIAMISATLIEGQLDRLVPTIFAAITIVIGGCLIVAVRNSRLENS